MEEFIGELIAALIIFVPMGLAYWHMIYNSRQEKNKEIATKIDGSVSFDSTSGTLIVHDLHPHIYRVVTMGPYEIIHTAHQPESYTFTSVTVGNVTTGGVTKNEAYNYISGTSKTDKYELRYLNSAIRKIELRSESLKNAAKAAGLEKYMNSAGTITVVGQSRVSQSAMTSALSGYYAQMQLEGLDAQPGYDKCKRILDFLHSRKGEPVPKAVVPAAELKARRRSLVGLLVTFLVLGGIAAMMAPGFMEEDIVSGLSGTYMELDPDYFDGTRYKVKFSVQRYGDERTLRVNGYDYDVYTKNVTWTRVRLTGGDLGRYLPFTDPLILKYKWVNGETEATQLLDSEGNVLWSNLPEDRYASAMELMEDGYYYLAIDIFRALEGYADSAEKIAECEQLIADLEHAAREAKYAAAVALMEEGRYEEAIAAFQAMNGYKDSAEKIAECKQRIIDEELAVLDGRYADAVALMETDVVGAYEALIALEGYKDSKELAASIYEDYKTGKRNAAQVGDYILFGSYEQDNITANGKEEVEWLVLERQENRILVISRDGLDCQPYNTKYMSVTWSTSTLRSWLNSEFINAAFTSEERALIPRSTVPADSNPRGGTYPGPATQDQIFLLSIAEANKYERTLDGAYELTDYAVARGGERGWWLRSPGYAQDNAAIYGDTRGWGVAAKVFTVRPAMWISIDP